LAEAAAELDAGSFVLEIDPGTAKARQSPVGR
jgi:hypothetical protein